jgi:hypothetical protein
MRSTKIDSNDDASWANILLSLRKFSSLGNKNPPPPPTSLS